MEAPRLRIPFDMTSWTEDVFFKYKRKERSTTVLHNNDQSHAFFQRNEGHVAYIWSLFPFCYLHKKT